MVQKTETLMQLLSIFRNVQKLIFLPLLFRSTLLPCPTKLSLTVKITYEIADYSRHFLLQTWAKVFFSFLSSSPVQRWKHYLTVSYAAICTYFLSKINMERNLCIGFTQLVKMETKREANKQTKCLVFPCLGPAAAIYTVP